MTDAKEWVTIRVPRADRDTAKDRRPEDATHGDCLVAGAERLNEHLDSEPDITATVRPEVDEDALEDIETRINELKNNLSMADELGVELDTERLFAAIETIEERTGRLEQMLEEMGAQR